MVYTFYPRGRQPFWHIHGPGPTVMVTLPVMPLTLSVTVRV
jgi:hypothetical protein